jgi:aerobic C4-dicarboxylate transport protein
VLLGNQATLRPARRVYVMAVRGAEKRQRWYAALYVQVLLGIAAGILVGWIAPQAGEALRPIGDIFLKMIKMVIGLVIFCTVVNGLGSMSDLKKVGRVGGKALIYFEVVSTLALLFGAIVANVVRPGAGFNADPARLDSAAVAAYVGHAQQHSAIDFLMGIVPSTLFDAFARGDTLPIIFVSVLFGYVLSRLGERGKPVCVLVESLSQVVFGIIHILMRFAPLGAFGAMAYTIGRFGMGSLKPLFGLIATFYVTGAVFVCVVMGAISRWAGFNIFKLMRYLKEELLITLGAASSDVALPSLMEKLTHLGCSRSVVGLVVPTGYVFNADGTSIYMTLAALFVAQAMNIELSLVQQMAIFGVAMLASKGASGITGAGFIALVATLSVVPDIPLAGMALILGIDRFMSAGRAVVNIIGNAVAAVVMASLEGELDRARMLRVLSGAALDELPAGNALRAHVQCAPGETNRGTPL